MLCAACGGDASAEGSLALDAADDVVLPLPTPSALRLCGRCARHNEQTAAGRAALCAVALTAACRDARGAPLNDGDGRRWARLSDVHAFGRRWPCVGCAQHPRRAYLPRGFAAAALLYGAAADDAEHWWAFPDALFADACAHPRDHARLVALGFAESAEDRVLLLSVGALRTVARCLEARRPTFWTVLAPQFDAERVALLQVTLPAEQQQQTPQTQTPTRDDPRSTLMMFRVPQSPMSPLVLGSPATPFGSPPRLVMTPQSPAKPPVAAAAAATSAAAAVEADPLLEECLELDDATLEAMEAEAKRLKGQLDGIQQLAFQVHAELRAMMVVSPPQMPSSSVQQVQPPATLRDFKGTAASTFLRQLHAEAIAKQILKKPELAQIKTSNDILQYLIRSAAQIKQQNQSQPHPQPQQLQPPPPPPPPPPHPSSQPPPSSYILESATVHPQLLLQQAMAQEGGAALFNPPPLARFQVVNMQRR